MVKVVGFGRYSVQGAAGVVANGFGSRRDVLASAAKELGGSQDGYWVVSDARWDFMFMWELPDAAQMTFRAMLIAAQSTGGYDASELFVLLDPDDVDRARADVPGFKPPNA
jgi:hypothetical protein